MATPQLIGIKQDRSARLRQSVDYFQGTGPNSIWSGPGEELILGSCCNVIRSMASPRVIGIKQDRDCTIEANSVAVLDEILLRSPQKICIWVIKMVTQQKIYLLGQSIQK